MTAREDQTGMYEGALLAAEINLMKRIIVGLKDSIKKLVEAQSGDQSEFAPPFQADLIRGFHKRWDVHLDFALFMLEGKKVNVPGVIELLKEFGRDTGLFFEAVEHFTLPKDHWLKTKAPHWFAPWLDVLGDAAVCLGSKAAENGK